DAAAEPGVLGLVDDPHAAAAERLQGEVVGEGLADRHRAWISAFRARDRGFGRSVCEPRGLVAPRAENLLRRVTLGWLDRRLAMRTSELHGVNSAEGIVPPLVRAMIPRRSANRAPNSSRFLPTEASRAEAPQHTPSPRSRTMAQGDLTKAFKIY